MNKKFIGATIAVLVVVAMGAAVLTYDWGFDDEPQSIPFEPADDGTLSVDSLNYQLFEEYGALLLALGVLMFGALIGASCVAREEADEDDSD
ncbi:MAG: hypothetical protein PHI62_00920 [Candidatus Methanomethylophilaceae archaeon]|nr:hypothetical protein [Candidatus Methanomethylophilaceae archaeon]